MRFEDKIKSLLLAYPGSITSWIRSPKRNKAVGGAAHSMHLVGLAVDIVLDDPKQNYDCIQMATRIGGLWMVDEGDHIHMHQKEI